MRLYILVYLLVIILYSCNSVSRLYVKYGDAQQYKPINSQAIRIYFDRLGFVYPGTYVSDAVMKDRDSRLNQVYSSDRAFYNSVCGQYNTTPYSGDWNDITTYNDPLQETLISMYVDSINKLIENRIPVFIIHGFNEHPTKPDSINSCFGENTITADSVRKIFPGREFQFVEVYWDGMTAQNGAGLLKPFNSIKIWNNAQVSATYAGLELRRILARLKTNKIYVITHSHGAGVITTALFNTYKFRCNLYDNIDSWLYDINHNRYKNKIYNTPTQDIYIGMLAPAIPGENTFTWYCNRTINGSNQKTNLENYHFVVGFNSNDVVTSKGGVFMKKFGSTTLASRKQELIDTRALFNNDSSILSVVDFSTFSSGKRQTKHSWLVYMDNQPYFTEFLECVFKE